MNDLHYFLDITIVVLKNTCELPPKMKKRLLVAFVFLGFLSIAHAATYTVDGTNITLIYEVNDGEVSIADCNTDAEGDLEIPVTIADMPVAGISPRAFAHCVLLTKVTIPNGVSRINNYVFYDCVLLASIIIPESVTNIDEYAFLDCSSLVSVSIPNSVTSIGKYAFSGCTSLSSLTIPNNVTAIDNNTFNGCTSLENVTIPDGVTSIGYDAFSDCSSLAIVDIPDSVTEIGSSAFSGCSLLAEIVIPYGVTSIHTSTFSDCTSLTSVTIPSSVSSIGSYAFYGCESLENVTINDSVTSIGYYAFCNCTSLLSVDIPDSVAEIGSYAFRGCTDLMSIAVGTDNSSYTSVDGVLYDKSLTEILVYPAGKTSISFTIPEGISSVSAYAFSGCTSLVSIDIPDSVTEIGSYAFYGCTLLTSITIPDSVIDIGSRVFRGCTDLMSIAVGTNNSSYASVDGVLYDKSLTEILAYPAGKTSISFAIPEGISSIGAYTFSGCTSLVSVDIPDSVTEIGSYAFIDCTSLVSMIIPVSLTSIGTGVFRGCTDLISIEVDANNASYASVDGVLYDKSLTEIVAYPVGKASVSFTIAENVTSIASNAFVGCTSLTRVIFQGDAPDSLGNYVFSLVADGFTVYYFDGAEGFTGATWADYNCVMLTRGSFGDLDGDGWSDEFELSLGTKPEESSDCFRNWISRDNDGTMKMHYGPYSDQCTFETQWTSRLADSDSWQALDGLSYTGDDSEKEAELPDSGSSVVFYRMVVTEVE